MRVFSSQLLWIFLWSVSFLHLGELASNAETPPKPNFIMIFTDDQGYHDLGCFGSEKIDTPFIDQMAREGIRFTDFYAQAVCGPSRAALMTGCYPIRIGEPGNRKNQHTILHPDEITLAELLKSVGYSTAIVGKWHLGERDGKNWNLQTMPNRQGFDEFFGTPLFNGATVHVEDVKTRSPLMRNEQIVTPAVQSWDHITQDYTKEAIDFITRQQDRPFFLYLAHNMPHIPLGASEDFKGKSEYGLYGDAIEELDWSTGKILKTLRELNLEQRTLVVYTSDNGPWIEVTHGNRPDAASFIPPEHSGSADPLKGYKMLTWEGGLRVPCVMWWPGHLPAGTVCRQPAATIDLYPTFARLAGVDLPEGLNIDGRDLSPLLWNPEATDLSERTFYFYCYTHLQAVRQGDWKLVVPRQDHPPWTGWSGRFYNSGVEELSLFNLRTDMAETVNVAGEQPEILARMKQLYEQGRSELGDYDRIGNGARFHDPGPKRPDVWKPGTSGRNHKLIKYDHAEPVGNLRFDFESGKINGWKVVEGQFDRLVTNEKGLPNHTYQPFNKQGRYLLHTGGQTGTSRGEDKFTGIIESPAFRLNGDQMSFLIGGGRSRMTRVILIDSEGQELLTATGTNGPALQRITWDVSKWKGQTLKLRIIDRKTAGWGHVSFDDFSTEATLIKKP